MMAEFHRDITRTVLGVLFIGALIVSSLWILRPFLGAIVWAATIVLATWPFMISIQKLLWNKRALAVTAMTLLLLCVLVVPLTAAISAIVSRTDGIAGLAKSIATFNLPSPPDWVGKFPLIGGKAVQVWEQVVATGVQEFALKAAPYIGEVVKWLLVRAGSLVILVVEFLLTVLLSAIMYAKGESAARGVMRFGRRLAGPRGEASVRLAGQAVRGVALGVVVTALAQSILGGISLAIAGVPFSPVLTGLMFMLAISQIGVLPVMGLSVLWLFLQGSTGWGVFLIVCTLVVGTMDNFLRPILIKKGADLPLLLIFTGVVGGLVAFGLIGLFIGPVVLAVAHKLLEAWVDEDLGGAETADQR